MPVAIQRALTEEFLLRCQIARQMASNRAGLAMLQPLVTLEAEPVAQTPVPVTRPDMVAQPPNRMNPLAKWGAIAALAAATGAGGYALSNKGGNGPSTVVNQGGDVVEWTKQTFGIK